MDSETISSSLDTDETGIKINGIIAEKNGVCKLMK